MVVGLLDTESHKNDCFPVYDEAKRMQSNLGHISRIHTEDHSFFVLVSVKVFSYFPILIFLHLDKFIYLVLFDVILRILEAI